MNKMNINKVSKTTPNVLRSKERKKKNREARRVADILEAEELGITVSELKSRRFKEIFRLSNRS